MEAASGEGQRPRTATPWTLSCVPGTGQVAREPGRSCSRAVPNSMHTAAAEDHPAAGCQDVHREGWAAAPLLSCSRPRCATLVLSARWNAAQGTSPGLQVRFQHCYRLSKAAPTAPAAVSHPRRTPAPRFHFGGRSQLRADIWSWCLVTSLQTAAVAATSEPIHGSPLPVLSAVTGSAAILRHGRHRCEHRHMYVLTHAFTPQESEWRWLDTRLDTRRHRKAAGLAVLSHQQLMATKWSP